MDNEKSSMKELNNYFNKLDQVLHGLDHFCHRQVIQNFFAFSYDFPHFWFIET